MGIRQTRGIMIPPVTKRLVLFFCLLVFTPFQVVRADTGPKPQMEFQFRQEVPGERLTISSGILYECEQANCSDAAPLEEAGPQRFSCSVDGCRATAYGFAPYHRIEITFSDGSTRQSNVFETAGFDSLYTVTIRPDDLLVEAQFNLGGLPRTAAVFVLACLCGLAAAALVIGLVAFLVRRPQKN